MKNNFLKIVLILLLSLNFFYKTFSDEFNFNITELQVLDNGNIIKGINGGTVTSINNNIVITANNFEYQINSFRKDILSTGRHTKVAKALTLEEDSKRRDFTFNSIYINLLGEAFDLYDGISHFKNSYLKL